MPLRRSPLFCARNSRLRGGEDPGRGRRGSRSREEGAPVAGRLRLRGRGRPQYGDGWSRGLCGRSGRWGGWPRIAWNAGTAAVERPEKPADREERLRAGSREARGRHIVKRGCGRAVGTPGWRIVAGRCRGAGGALPCRGGKIGPRARGGFSRCRRNGVKRADFRLRVWKYGRKGYLCPRKRFPRGTAAGIKRECSASLQQFPLL